MVAPTDSQINPQFAIASSLGVATKHKVCVLALPLLVSCHEGRGRPPFHTRSAPPHPALQLLVNFREGRGRPQVRTGSTPPRPALPQDHTPLLAMAKIPHKVSRISLVD